MANHFGNPGGTILSHKEGFSPQVVTAMKRRAQMGQGVNRMAQSPFNPFIQNLDIPQDYSLRNTYKRHFFRTNPIVGAAIELHCLPAGEAVLTRDGVESIERLQPGSLVLSTNGVWQKVLGTDVNQYEGEVYCFKVNGLPPFRCTDQHPILVRSSIYRKVSRVNTAGKIVKDSARSEPSGVAEWKFAKDLQVGDYVLIPKYNHVQDFARVDLGNYTKGDTSGSYRIVDDTLVSPQRICQRHIELSHDLGELLGWYVAEGSSGTDFSLNVDEVEEATRITELLKTCASVTALAPVDRESKLGHRCKVLHFSYAPFGRWLLETCGSGAADKRVPRFILDSADLGLVRRFLQAYWQGDGCSVDFDTHFVTVSRTLGYQLQMLFGKLGVAADLKIRIHPHTGGTQYTVRVTKRDWMTNVLLQPHGLKHKGSTLTVQDEDFFYAPIRKISHQHESCLVYDLHTEDHSFATPFLVHNSEFPLSDFHLEHEDSAIEEFLNDMLKEANFYEHTLMKSMEYWLIGEGTSFAFYDDPNNPSCYTGFSLLDPNKILVASSPFIQSHQREVVQLMFDPVFQKIVEGGPHHPLTGTIYQNLPSDMVAYARARQPMPLSPLQVTRIKRGSQFNLRGDSALERVFPLLMLKDELRSLQRVIAKRAINPIEVWKIGEAGEPADQAEIEAFRDTLQQTFYEQNASIVWHHAINCQIIGSEGRMPQLWSEFDAIDNEVCAGLLINKGLILGDSSTFASDVVRLDILIQRYILFRTRLETWIRNGILAPIMKIHEMYVPENKVKSMRYREMCGKGRPLSLPRICWDKASLRDENAKVTLLTQLVEKKLVPESNLLALLNIDPRTAQDKVEKEMMAKIDRHAKILKDLQSKGIAMTPEIAQILGFKGDVQPDGGPMGGMPASIDTGGGGSPMPATDLPDVVPGANPGGEGGATAAIASQPGVQGAPSESHMPVGLPAA